VPKATQLSCLCVPFTEQLDSLLDRLDNWRTMHSSRNEALDCCCGNRSSAHYYIHVTLCDYKYAFRLAQMTISHSSFSRLGFRFLALGLLALENKRSTKRSRSPSAERSPSPSESKTPLLVPSGSPTPPRSPSEISSCRPHSPVFEQGGSSGNVLVIDLSIFR
jgi:hypothetical protein